MSANVRQWPERENWFVWSALSGTAETSRDHAEHEYMTMVVEHPDWESTPFEPGFADNYGTFASLGDLIRQIGHDERIHKQESEAQMRQPRVR